MKIDGFIKWWKQLVVTANDRGIPIPMARDPQTLEGSVSLTLVCMSAFLVVVGIVGKASGLIGGIDMNSAFNFFYASTTLYFGHSWINKEPVAAAEVIPAKPPKVDDPGA